MFAMIKEYKVLKVTDIVKGGKTRQESVFNAIRRSSPLSEYFAIHDGARPLVTEKIIEESGLDIAKIDNIDLLANQDTEDINGEDEVIFGKVLLHHAYDVFSDDMLEYDADDILHTLHVLQNVEKNRIIISIPLPIKFDKKGIGSADMRQHFVVIVLQNRTFHNPC